MDYNSLGPLSTSDKSSLSAIFSGILATLKHVSINKITNIIRFIPDMSRMHHNSLENRQIKNLDPNKLHPVRPHRGEIYNAKITEGIGSELSGYHLVVIVQNTKGNMYSEKVNVLPIEGDGSKINPKYQLRLTNSDLVTGHIDKDPSRIIISDIMTIDKARLDRRIGELSPQHLQKIDDLLKAHLSLV